MCLFIPVVNLIFQKHYLANGKGVVNISGLKHFLGFILGNSLTVTLRYQSNERTSISLQIQINTQQPL